MVLVYGDYDDRFTRGACAALANLHARTAFRHFPRTGTIAAVAAEAAAELGAFWPMHDVLLRHDGAPLDGAELRRFATEAGLDPEHYEEVFGSDAQMARIRDDVRGAVAAGVDEPPALFLDGERLPSYDADWLAQRLATQ